jgi:dTDP-4-dehydrorhamnose 3,5-epimerase
MREEVRREDQVPDGVRGRASSDKRPSHNGQAPDQSTVQARTDPEPTTDNRQPPHHTGALEENRPCYHPPRLKITSTTLPGVLILEPQLFADARGWFIETFNAARFAEHGLPDTFAQDNHSYSTRGVVRGLHYQLEQPQGKLVRCTRGAILDVAVDIRRGSPTFGQWTAVELSAENRRMLWIPPKFAHGFSVLSEDADVLYKCTTPWHQPSDRSLLWNDPTLGIDWQVEQPSLSPKDAAAKPLAEADLFEY